MFLFACVTLVPLALYSAIALSATVIVALLVCLIPTTIGGLLSAIGIAGMDRLLRKNVIAMSGRAVEAAGDVDTLLLDKTGTITLGNRMATELIPSGGVRLEELADAAQLASLADETPEGRSIVDAGRARSYDLRGRDVSAGGTFVPFTAQTRMSGCDLPGRSIRKGAVDAVATYVAERGGAVPHELKQIANRIGDSGGTPLAVSDGARVLGHHPPQGRREGRHQGALRPLPGDGHPHRDDHRRQPAHGSRHRQRGGRRRLPGRGDARGQDAASSRTSRRRASSSR